MSWTPVDIEQLEVELTLEAIYRRYGYDFRQYSRAALVRRLRALMHTHRLGSLTELQGRLVREPEFFRAVLSGLTVPVTEMFRDPAVFRKLRDEVFPFLGTYTDIRIWHAGCASGEETYSLAILLDEAGLLERSIIYGTDINPEALARAREGVFALEGMAAAGKRYFEAGGRKTLSDYYVAAYDAAALDSRLREHVVFSDHNLASDAVFGQMNLVICRNVLIYFARELQERVLRLFLDSLIPGGFLCIGSKESLYGRSVADELEPVEARERIYRRRVR